MRVILCLILLLHALLGGCAAQPTTNEIQVPVPIPCVYSGDVPDPPAVTDNELLLKMDRRTRTLLVWDERDQLKGYAEALRQLLRPCTAKTTLPPS